jgi:hypothetical protein
MSSPDFIRIFVKFDPNIIPSYQYLHQSQSSSSLSTSSSSSTSHSAPSLSDLFTPPPSTPTLPSLYLQYKVELGPLSLSFKDLKKKLREDIIRTLSPYDFKYFASIPFMTKGQFTHFSHSFTIFPNDSKIDEYLTDREEIQFILAEDYNKEERKKYKLLGKEAEEGKEQREG